MDNPFPVYLGEGKNGGGLVSLRGGRIVKANTGLSYSSPVDDSGVIYAIRRNRRGMICTAAESATTTAASPATTNQMMTRCLTFFLNPLKTFLMMTVNHHKSQT